MLIKKGLEEYDLFGYRYIFTLTIYLFIAS